MINFYLPEPTSWSNPVDIIYGGNSDYADSNSVYEFKKVYRNLNDSNIHRI